jgi:hypothetical protein
LLRLGELDDHIGFFNDHAGDVGVLETTVIAMQNNIPTLPLSGTQVNYTNADNEVKAV